MQQDSATTRSIEGKDGPAITVGLDVGDRYTHVHALGAGGEVIRERRVRTAAAALGAALTGLPPAVNSARKVIQISGRMLIHSGATIAADVLGAESFVGQVCVLWRVR